MAHAFAQFETGPDGAPAWFAEPALEIVAREASEVDGALAELDRARAQGLWLAGYASHELGHALEPSLTPLLARDRRLPLLRFFGYPRPPEPLAAARAASGAATLGGFAPRWSRRAYGEAFRRVKDYLAAGDAFQVNLTFEMRGVWSGDARALQRALARKQTARHGALLDFPGDPILLCHSPERFFATDAERNVVVQPMKGTAPRDRDPARDAALREGLLADPKIRAENLMIVDLMRNDVSRIAEIGSVRVGALFAIQSLATVHQMTSTIEARLLAGRGLAEILRALFPCGSVTGAPKIRAIEIIAELEPRSREVYCGAIGWAAPDGRADFAVAIRTLALERDGRARLDVGGGIVADSEEEGEWREALWKARFAERP